jgi:hypothetical protein
MPAQRILANPVLGQPPFASARLIAITSGTALLADEVLSQQPFAGLKCFRDSRRIHRSPGRTAMSQSMRLLILVLAMWNVNALSQAQTIPIPPERRVQATSEGSAH